MSSGLSPYETSSSSYETSSSSYETSSSSYETSSRENSGLRRGRMELQRLLPGPATVSSTTDWYMVWLRQWPLRVLSSRAVVLPSARRDRDDPGRRTCGAGTARWLWCTLESASSPKPTKWRGLRYALAGP